MAVSRIFGKNAEMSRIWQPVEPKARKTSGNPDRALNSWGRLLSFAFDSF